MIEAIMSDGAYAVMSAMCAEMCRRNGHRATALFLSFSAVQAARTIVQFAMRNMIRPFAQPSHVALWAAGSVALVLLPAAVGGALGLRALGWKMPVWFACVSAAAFACVIGAIYPALRGDALMTFYACWYAYWCGTGAFALVVAAVTGMRTDERSLSLLLVLLSHCAAALMSTWYGHDAWPWVNLTHAITYCTAAVVALRRPSPLVRAQRATSA